MLLNNYDYRFFHRELKTGELYRPFPPASERASWDKLIESDLNRVRLEHITGIAEEIHPEGWKVLPATLYMEFSRNGNRNNYETEFFKRRRDLGILVIAECMEYKGRFLDKITDALWAILEESSWCIPAHAARLEADPLPRHDEYDRVDLFAAETAMVLGEAYYLLRDALWKISPSLCNRIKSEIRKRVILPVLSYPDNFWWIRGSGNWSPWCSSNVLGAAMYTQEDKGELAILAGKLTAVVDRYFENYPKDGGCDEGVMYWGVSAGAVLVFLEVLYCAVSGKIDIFHEPFIRDMAGFIEKAYIGGEGWFWGFADCIPKLSLHRGRTYRFAERTGSENLKNLVLLSMHEWNKDGQISVPFEYKFTGASLSHILQELFWIPGDAIAEKQKMALSTWFPELQLWMERENIEGSGFTVFAKGGHNGERHNHNDVGHFTVFYDNNPLIVDLGTGVYSRDNFSNERYSLWHIRGSAHNAPLVNGFEQAQGREYQAGNVIRSSAQDIAVFAMELENVYPKDAGVKYLKREITLDRNTGKTPLTLKDSVEIEAGKSEISINMYSPAKVTLPEDGLIVFNEKAGMFYEKDKFKVEVSDVSINDERMRISWGGSLRKITLRYPASSKGEYSLKFKRI
ncbi:MAG: hypothetical protein A2017_07125 [Lentisphaerae bacterium GWF2_44_16]|nr:MAG: hypothetical protein A2017_07125 [Lentisphaerae bacterium GWF2_44_16]